MIIVPSNNPNTGAISFLQKASTDPVLAATQIAKSSREQVIARGELEVAQARLAKAVTNLQASEIAYFEAVEKGADVSVAKSAYNNAQAGVRDAKAEIASANTKFDLADKALAGLHALSKGEVVKSAPSAPIAPASNVLPAPTNKFAKATEGITMEFKKENGMVEEELYLCPVCCGSCPTTCPCCEGKNDGLVSEERWEMFPADEEEDFAKSFSTASLLTRDFQKAVGFQAYIAKGGASSGRYPKGTTGHGGKGDVANQHTGKLENTRAKDETGNIIRVGWKTRNKNYENTFASMFKVGREAMRQADKLRSEADRTKDKSTFAKASALYAEASKSLMIAQGAAKGIETTLRKYADQGHKDASHVKADEWQEKAADVRNMGYGAKHLSEVCSQKAGIA